MYDDKIHHCDNFEKHTNDFEAKMTSLGFLDSGKTLTAHNPKIYNTPLAEK